MKNAIGIIPARFGSRRFPGKLLAPIQGKPMIQWVYDRASTSTLLERVIIATDDERILRAAHGFGAEACMTDPGHESGTERAAEVAENLEAPILLCIQGDEPLLRGEMLDSLIEALQDDKIPMATLAQKMEDFSDFHAEGSVKVVCDHSGFSLYFSRSPLPHGADDFFWKHIGIYGFQRDFLLAFPHLPSSRLEKRERLEQLRVLENGYRIKIIETNYQSFGVNYPDDIQRIEEIMKKEAHD